MSTLTPRLGLIKVGLGDNYRTQDYADNVDTLEQHPGVFPCLSTGRPSTWTTAHAGMLISETDTGLLWRWDGTAFVRAHPKGRLGGATRTTDLATSSTSLVVALSAAVTVPAGGRRVMLAAEGPGVYSTAGVTRLALFRGATQLRTWLSQGRLGATAAEQPVPLAMTFEDTPGAGSQTYTLQVAAEVGFGGTSTLQAATNSPLALRVVEV